MNLIDSVQQKFLKYLALHIDGKYPEQGREYKIFLNRFNFDSLHFRKYFHSLKLLHTLINNIDCLEPFKTNKFCLY